MGKLTALGMAVAIAAVPVPLAAEGKYDGSVPLLCVPIEGIECEVAGKCLAGTAESVNLPQFLRVDVQNKKISAADKSGRETAIRYLERANGRLIMQGVQGGRGWTMVISEETGKMSGTVSEDEVGFVIFGACTPL